MNILKKIIFLVAIIFLLSCERQLNYKFNTNTPNKLAVYCFFYPDSIWKVQVYKIQSIEENIDRNNLFVNNATVKIYEDDTLTDILRYQGKGIYISQAGKSPTENHSYYIEVSADGYETVKSQKKKLPVMPQIRLLSYTDSIAIPLTFDEGDYEYYKDANLFTYTCEIKDGNIIEIQGKVGHLTYFTELRAIDYEKYEIPYAPYWGKFIRIQKQADTLIFVLACNTLDTTIYPYSEITNANSLEMSIYNIDEDYVKLYYNLIEQFDEQTTINTSIFFSPTIQYSNMLEGIGVFCGFSKPYSIQVPFRPPDRDFF